MASAGLGIAENDLAGATKINKHYLRTTMNSAMLVSFTALLSAALVMMRPTPSAALGAGLLNAAASIYGWLALFG